MVSHEELNAYVKELAAAYSVCAPLKELAQKWLDAEGSAAQTDLTELLKQELKEDVTAIDDLIGLCESETGVKLFGADKAGEMAKQGRKVKDEGGKYCFCPACEAGVKILEALGE